MFTGWLSPDAEFIECEWWEHEIIAEDIANKLGIRDENIPSDELLIEHGWIRISMLTTIDIGMVFGKSWRHFATDQQKIYLRKIFDEDKSIISPNGFDDLYQLGVIDKEELDAARMN